jgi:hypothetical protein
MNKIVKDYDDTEADFFDGDLVSGGGYANGADFNPWDNDPNDMLEVVVGYEDDDLSNEGDDWEAW